MSSTNHHTCNTGHVCTIVPITLLERIAAHHDQPEAREAAKRTIAHTRAFQASARYSFGTPGHHHATFRQSAHHGPQQGIVPANILQGIIDSDEMSDEVKEAARSNLKTSQAIRAARGGPGGGPGAPTSGLKRVLFDAEKQSDLPGIQVRVEGRTLSEQDVGGNFGEVWNGFEQTYNFYRKVFNRNSIDDSGMKLVGSVHYDDDDRPPGYDNAFWSSEIQQMVFGDGDQIVFSSFTKSVDVIGHELTHGVTEKTAALPYHLQSGALNESISDVFGSMVKQWSKGQDAASADWLIGEGMFMPGFGGKALRSMKAPGTAFDDPRLGGKDDQPAHMRDIVILPDDDEPGSGHDMGGVHTNSGIPNHAFYLAAVGLKGNSWDRAGPIWYKALRDTRLRAFASQPDNYDSCFQFFADLTVEIAGSMYDGDAQAIVKDAWNQVGL